MGINVIESEEQEEAEEAARIRGRGGARVGQSDDEDIGRTDDPVRMYLREMGSVELLSREGEIAIAKRIEAGRDMMIGGICESPLTIDAIIGWRDALMRPAACCSATSSISTRPMAAVPMRGLAEGPRRARRARLRGEPQAPSRGRGR